MVKAIWSLCTRRCWGPDGTHSPDGPWPGTLFQLLGLPASAPATPQQGQSPAATALLGQVHLQAHLPAWPQAVPREVSDAQGWGCPLPSSSQAQGWADGAPMPVLLADG